MPSVDSAGSEKRNFTSTFKAKGLRGIVAGTPGSVGNKLAEIWRGQEKPEDPNAPRLEDFRNLLTNKGSLVDEHGLRVPEAKRKRFKTKLEEEIRPDMTRMWMAHISSIRKIYDSNPGFFLHDKSSYAYHQLLQIKQFLNPTSDPTVLGTLNQGKLDAYFATSAGYTETMRYFETEAYRLQCANDVIAVTKNGYSPDTLKGVQIGLSTADIVLLRTSLALRFGSNVAVGAALDYLIYVTGVVGSLAMLAPQILPVLPWVIPGAVAGAILSRHQVEALFTKNSPQQIMQMCHGMFAAIQGTGYATECEYLREMYGIDPRELRVANVNPPRWSYDSKGSTTGGWNDSRSNILEIKNLRRRLYVDAMGIEERDMYGVPEEAFVDAQGNFRRRVMPEGGGVRYQQEIWNQFYRMGGYQRYDASGALQDLTPLEAMQRFHEARLQLNMESAERNARTILSAERSSNLTKQKNQIDNRVSAIISVAAKEKTKYTDKAMLYSELNGGANGVGGLSAYWEKWQGPSSGNITERLRGLTEVRQEIYNEIRSIITFTGKVEDLTEGQINDAIKEIEKRLDPATGTVGKKYTDAKTYYDANPEDIADVSLPKKKDGSVQMVKNGKYPAAKDAYDRALQEKDNLEALRKKLDEDVRRKLANKLAEFQPGHEHSKAHDVLLETMQKAYDELEKNMGKRVPPIHQPTPPTFDAVLDWYPGPFTVLIPNPAYPSTPPVLPTITENRSGIDGLTKTLGSETGLWREDEDTSQARRMTVLYAVAWKQIKDELATIDGAGGKGAAIYEVVGSTHVSVKDLWEAARQNGTLTEMGVLAHNTTELANAGTLVVSGVTVDMKNGDNAALRAYIQTRQEAYTMKLDKLVKLHETRKHIAEVQAQKVDEKYQDTRDHYGVILESITAEQGTDQNNKVSSQVHIRGLTGSGSIRQLCDIRRYASRTQFEQDAYHDYERAFLQKFTDFPPAMLEFLDVLFNYRVDPRGKEKLDNVYAALTEVGGTGRGPQDMLADIIYQAANLRDVLVVSRDAVIANVNPATGNGFNPRFRWSELVLTAFDIRQSGRAPTSITPGEAQYLLPCVPRHYSASEMNGILLSIHDQIIRKVVNQGVI